jgi:RHS repeat-associated protein
MDAYSGFNGSTNQWTSLNILQDYRERVSYDANGNIQTYQRNAQAANLAMDNLSYHYLPGSNKLGHVDDAVAAGAHTADIDDQDVGNYTYDDIGNLITDQAEGINGIVWTVYGKIRSINKTDGTLIEYQYDPAGNRLSKAVTRNSVTEKTFYIRDGQGNVMGIYRDSASYLNWDEQHLYGSSRLGIWAPGRGLPSASPNPASSGPGIYDEIIYGSRYYELSNHLGNVLAVISDKKVGVDAAADNVTDYYTAEVLSMQDYYPFGMGMPGRKFSAGSYRYGFNGKEEDDEVKGDGNQQDYGMRIYDPRLGRFLSVDPLTRDFPELTPFQFGSCNPIQNIDLDGLEGSSGNGAPTNTQPPQLIRGNTAHNLFTSYIRSLDPTETFWTANRTILGKKDRSRPDLTFGKKNSSLPGGVWELKPGSPSPSEPLALSEATKYAESLNKAQNTSRFGPGTSTGAPAPFVGVLPLLDPVTGDMYVYTHDNEGGIYYNTYPRFSPEAQPEFQNEPSNNPNPTPILVPISAPRNLPVPRINTPRPVLNGAAPKGGGIISAALFIHYSYTIIQEKKDFKKVLSELDSPFNPGLWIYNRTIGRILNSFAEGKK